MPSRLPATAPACHACRVCVKRTPSTAELAYMLLARRHLCELHRLRGEGRLVLDGALLPAEVWRARWAEAGGVA